MESLKSWAISICVFSIVLLFYRMLFPNGNLKKTGEIVISIFLLFMMIQPFTNLQTDAETLLPQTQWEDFYDSGQTAYYTAALESAVADSLAKIGVQTEQVDAKAVLDEEHYLVLSALELTVSAEISDTEIKAHLENDLEIPQEIITIVR